MPRVTGTLILNFDDTAEVERDLLAIVNCAIDINVDSLEGGNPDGLGWKYSGPNQSDWTASAFLNMDKTNGAPHVTQSEIEALAFAKTIFPVSLVAPTGAIYSGQAFVRGCSLATADQAVGGISLNLRGNGALTVTNPEPVEPGEEPLVVLYSYYLSDLVSDSQMRRIVF
jgi:hypothetical protein